jgi:hypothetical protein
LKHEGPSEGATAVATTVVRPAAGDGGGDFQLRTAVDYLKTWKIFRAEASHPKGT